MLKIFYVEYDNRICLEKKEVKVTRNLHKSTRSFSQRSRINQKKSRFFSKTGLQLISLVALLRPFGPNLSLKSERPDRSLQAPLRRCLP